MVTIAIMITYVVSLGRHTGEKRPRRAAMAASAEYRPAPRGYYKKVERQKYHRQHFRLEGVEEVVFGGYGHVECKQHGE
ncbi:MAG: hypothetical protein L6V80_07220 [Bacteroidales bacterium]|nr:MAG: hypothetical protein L6V80_07220 [Bacteroidales bacterium]